MGNRGQLHNAARELVRDWNGRIWITCRLSFRNKTRKPLMQTTRYTELFFLDEATALAAGHRPCGLCRHADYVNFKSSWLAVNGHSNGTTIAMLDKMLHEDRTTRLSSSQWRRCLSSLPSGVIVTWEGEPHLWTGQALRKWEPIGYGPVLQGVRLDSEVALVTPPSVVSAISFGYVVQVHASAGM
jgi:hypothetical protein